MVLSFLLQAVSDTSPLVSLGVGGGIAALVVTWWRIDRKEAQERYERLAKESQDRYATLATEAQTRYITLAADFRTIVQDNTRALTVLSERFDADNAVTVRLLLEALRKNKILNVEPESENVNAPG